MAGQRVALNITGPRVAKEAVTRGDWVLHPEAHAPTDRIDAQIRLLGSESKPLRPEAMLHLHLAAADVMARVSMLDTPRLDPGGSALARLSLAHPIGALWGDRLVLRDAGAIRTLGGGAVVDPFPPLRGRRTPGRLVQLAASQKRAWNRSRSSNAVGDTHALPTVRGPRLPPPRHTALVTINIRFEYGTTYYSRVSFYLAICALSRPS